MNLPYSLFSVSTIMSTKILNLRIKQSAAATFCSNIPAKHVSSCIVLLFSLTLMDANGPR